MAERIYPHFSHGRFYNYPGERKESIIMRSLYMYLTGRRIRNSRLQEFKAWHVLENSKHDFHNTFSTDSQLMWIGHSTFLIKLQAVNILTDPIFGPSSFLFPRLLPPALTIAQLPRIDLVIISHNHRDHMDRPTLQAIARAWPDCRFLVPSGDAHWLKSWGINNVIELQWWSQHEVAGLRCTFLPAVHWSQRNLFDYNRSLWGSWMIESAQERIYFAGDTAYGKHFKLIAKEFGTIDTALMPIGPCEPRAWMRTSHINPQEAGQAFIDLQARHFVPMHWATFTFGFDDPLMAIERMLAWWQQHRPSDATLHALKIGEQLALGQAVKPINVIRAEHSVEF